MWSRIHLIPVLQAEEDRDLVRRHIADQAREKELLGENFKVYHTDRYASYVSSNLLYLKPIKMGFRFEILWINWINRSLFSLLGVD